MSRTDRLRRRAVLAGLAGLAAGARPAWAAREELTRTIGQCLIVGFSGAEPDDPGTRMLLDHAAAGRVGGVLLLDRNVRSAEQVRRLTRAIARAGGRHRVLIAADQEGGAIQRLGPGAGFAALPGARTLGRDGIARADAVHARMAADLSASGVNVNLGPVVDLARDGGQGVIGRPGRAYSADPRVVARMAESFVDAHRRAGIITVPKHFPGHGSTAQDSHATLPDIAATWRDDELVPYRALIGRGAAPAVMTGHLVHPRFSDRDGLPASLSVRATRALRRGLGFPGVIVTDDLHMEAVRLAVGSDEEAAVRALAAGADLLILSAHPRFDPGMVRRVHDAVAGAVARGRLGRPALARAAGRIAAMKRGWLAG